MTTIVKEPNRAAPGGRRGEGDKPEAGSNKRLVVMLVVLGVLVLFYAASKLMGGSDDPAAAPPPADPAVVAPAPTPTPSAEPVAPAETTTFFTGRDPFEPLLRGSTRTKPKATAPTRRRISMLDVRKNSKGMPYAIVAVDGRKFAVREGQVFATNFRLDSLAGECGSFTFGDEGFTLCVGRQVVK